MTVEVAIAVVIGLVTLIRIGRALERQAEAHSRLASVMERDLELRMRGITPCPDFPPAER